MALDEEKQRLERVIKEFQKEHEIMKLEYEETIEAMKMVQQDKEALQNTTQSLLVSTYSISQKFKQHGHYFTVFSLVSNKNFHVGYPLVIYVCFLQNNLSELEEEKKKILQNLHQPKGPNSRTSHSTQNLQVHLQGIEEEQRYLLEEKQEIEER